MPENGDLNVKFMNVSQMKGFRRVGLSTLLLGLFAWSGLAQTSTITATITTYAGPPIAGQWYPSHQSGH
jgi:hypothetical protein